MYVHVFRITGIKALPINYSGNNATPCTENNTQILCVHGVCIDGATYAIYNHVCLKCGYVLNLSDLVVSVPHISNRIFSRYQRQIFSSKLFG